MSESENKVEEERIKRNSFCPKSPTGKHKWKVLDGHWICELCKRMTDEELLCG